MQVYDSEREQLDAIKQWWKENGKAIVIGAILGIGSLIGWQQWQANVQAARETASVEYDLMLAELENGNPEGVKERAGRILGEYPKTPYAVLSALSLARVYMDEGDAATARAYLQQVVEQDKQPQLKQVAQLRLARLLLAEGEAGQALTLVNGMAPSGFEVPLNELRGDIHIAQGDRDEARAAYQRALEAFEPGLDSTMLQMKLDEVGGPEASD